MATAEWQRAVLRYVWLTLNIVLVFADVIAVAQSVAPLYGARVEDSALSQTAWDEIYADTDRDIAEHLRVGRLVVDASRNFRKQERERARRIALDVAPR